MKQIKKEYSPKATDTRCGLNRCGGGLADVTPMIVLAVGGRLHLKCDRCHTVWSVKTGTAEFKRKV